MSMRFITSALTIGALIATVGAAPARADSREDIGKLLGAAAAVFIVGKIIQHEQKQDREKEKEREKREKKEREAAKKREAEAKKREAAAKAERVARRAAAERPVVRPRTDYAFGGRPSSPSALPRACLVPVTGGDTRFAMDARCLERTYTGSRRLPQRCEVVMDGARRDSLGYSMRCLREEGFELAFD